MNPGTVYRSRIHGGYLTVIRPIMEDSVSSHIGGYIRFFKCLLHDSNTVIDIETYEFNVNWEPTKDTNKTVLILYGDK